MLRQPRLYKCPVCDTVVEVLEPCGLELVCCGPELVELADRTCRSSPPHAIRVDRHNGRVRVRVGRMPHAMERDHFIAWIELDGGGQCSRQFLRPGDDPEAIFETDGADFVVRAYCTAHGLWHAIAENRTARRRLTAAVSV